jgi:hypothetical protein
MAQGGEMSRHNSVRLVTSHPTVHDICDHALASASRPRKHRRLSLIFSRNNTCRGKSMLNLPSSAIHRLARPHNCRTRTFTLGSSAANSRNGPANAGLGKPPWPPLIGNRSTPVATARDASYHSRTACQRSERNLRRPCHGREKVHRG